MIYDEFKININSFKYIDHYYNSFNKIKNIQTDLLYGTPGYNAKPYLTLIIPTYSRADYFQEALESALRQKDPGFPWEIIVIDNTSLGSSGSTPALEIVRKLDCKVRFYHNRENIGAGYNWNRGVELAQGKWVSFLHDDDILCSDALKNIGHIISVCGQLKKPLGYIHARRQDFSDAFDEETAKKRTKPFLRRLTRTGALLKGHSQTGAPSCGTTVLRDAYISTGGINYDFGAVADAVLGYQIMKHYTVIESGEILGGYRWSENATLRKDVVINLVEGDRLFAKYRYNISLYSRLFGKFFCKLQDFDNMEKKYSLINDRLLNEILKEYKNNFIVQIVYKLILNIYHQLEKINRINSNWD